MSRRNALVGKRSCPAASRAGRRGHLVVLAPDLSVEETIVAGETVYKKGDDGRRA